MDTGPTRPPLTWAASDDFETVVGGETYYPHRGEAVAFAEMGTIGDVELVFAFDKIQNLDLAQLAPRQLMEAEEALKLLRTRLRDAISDWTWTRRNGERYPAPPDDDAIRALSLDEIGYLTRKLIAGVVALTDRAEGLAKNGGSPSTSRSTRRRAASGTKGTRTAAEDAGTPGA